MIPYTKILRSPNKVAFYGYFYLASMTHRIFSSSENKINIRGTSLTRPYLMWKVLKLLGIRAVDQESSLRYFHDDATTCSRYEGYINGDCVNIEKSAVGKVFYDTFNYELDIDPTVYIGKIVRKSELNATHDGVIIDGPISSIDEGYVYQKLINNCKSDTIIEDLRPLIMGNEIPYVYIKQRAVDIRFSNTNSKIFLKKSSEVFSDLEIKNILRFSKKINLDIGELDILRDKDSGLIYIVDVAKTPCSPGAASLNISGIIAMRRAAAAFKRQFID